MDTNDDFYGRELNLNCFYMHTNFGQKYPEMAIVSWDPEDPGTKSPGTWSWKKSRENDIASLDAAS